MPLVQTRGAASAQGFGEFAQAATVANYIEEVFSTYLYTGNSTSQTITNNIDLSTKGGLVWFKNRTAGSTGQMWYDTARGAYNYLQSNSTGAQTNGSPDGLSAFTTSGFSVSGASDYWNLSANNYVSWTFRKQPKFFDIVTWTGNGASDRQISHNLGSKPGFIVYKCTSTTGDWNAIARITNNSYSFGLKLNATNAQYVATNPSSTISTTWFVPEYFNGSISDSNANGETYVAYLFAHDAGGFGLTGTDNVISCGSYVGDGSGNAVVNLGYEPQFLLVKLAETFAEEWRIFDTMRGWDNSTSQGSAKQLVPNTSAAETTRGGWKPTATGFEVTSQSSGLQVIYIAIRRGPMKVPTDATKVFAPIARTGTGLTATVTSTVTPTDLMFSTNTDRVASSINSFWDRLRGASFYLNSNSTSAEVSNPSINGFDVQNGVKMTGNLPTNGNGYPYVNYSFGRAPSFFDEVCYTGSGVNRTLSHNLQAVPELMIVKCRSNVIDGWMIYSATLPASSKMILNRDYAELAGETTTWNSTRPTASVFSVGTEANVNNSGYTYVAYLFATCAGVSKVGSYTGTGTTQTINCGFTAGSRFVLIKRTDSTGDWYVWDSARGIVAGNDPYLLLNTTDAEVTGTDYIDTAATGFEISSTAPAAINASAGTFIFLAIA